MSFTLSPVLTSAALIFDVFFRTEIFDTSSTNFFVLTVPLLSFAFTQRSYFPDTFGRKLTFVVEEYAFIFDHAVFVEYL